MGQAVDVINQICILLIFVSSLNVLMGFAGQASVAHAALGGVGGYAAGYFSAHHGWPFLATLALGAAASAVLGTLVSFPALRLSWDYLVLLTLAVATIFFDVVSTAPQFGGAYGILGVKPVSIAGHALLTPWQMFPFVVAIATAVFAVCWRLGESPFGRVLKAIRGDEIATRSLGKNTVRYKVLTFGVTAALAGVGGALLVHYDQLVTPNQFGLDQSILFVTMMVLGGSGSLLGSVVGTALIYGSGPLLEHLVNVGEARAALLRLMVYGAALILLMRFRPQGAFRERATFWRAATTSAAAEAATAIPLRELATSIRTSVAPRQREASPTAHSSAQDPPMELTAVGLHKRFGGLHAVRGVDVSLRSGELVGLIGPNGAGKSTLFGMLAGFIRPDSGTITLGDLSIAGMSSHRIARMGLVRSFQDVRLFSELTVLDNVALAARNNPGERLGSLFTRRRAVREGEINARAQSLRWLEFVGMEKAADRVSGELSHAEQKLVALARALATGGQLLLLDEPTSGVEHRWIERLVEVIVELPKIGRGVCVVEHNLNFLRMLGAPCLFMENGEIAGHGTLDELMAVADKRKAYFGV